MNENSGLLSDGERTDVIAQATARMQRAMLARGATRSTHPRAAGSSGRTQRDEFTHGAHAGAGDTGASNGDTHSGQVTLEPRNAREELRARAMLGPLWALRHRSGAGRAGRVGLASGRLRWNEPRSIGRVIKKTTHDRGWDSSTAMGSVMAQWPVIVGDNVAQHCSIETFNDRTLIVRCSSTAWAKQLVLLLPHIERRIAEEVGAGVVDQVIVRGPSAPSWNKGRWSVKGRGVRDTYG